MIKLITLLFILFRVALGNISDFLSTSCITNLSFLGSQEEGMPDRKFSFLNLINH